jgi:hypothetical protein
MNNSHSGVNRPDRGKSISTGQRPVNDEYQQICALKGHQPLLSPFQGLCTSFQLRRALPHANAKRALPFSNDVNSYSFLFRISK